MLPSNDLFDLIKSLSRSEKRYFRLQMSRGGRGDASKYGRLFDLIDRQESYNEDAIRTALAGDPMVRNLPTAKNYLYNAIMRALHSYDLDNSVHTQIALLIHQADILFRRRLYGQFAKVVARGKEMSMRHDEWHLTLELLWREYTLLTLEGNHGGTRKSLEALLAEMEEVMVRLENQNRLKAIHTRLYDFVKSRIQTRREEEIEMLRGVLGDTFEQGEEIGSTPTARFYHDLNHALYRYGIGDETGSLRDFKRALERVDSGEMRRRESLASILHDICVMSISVRDEEGFFTHHARLKGLIDEDPNAFEYDTHVNIHLLPATWYMLARESEKGLEVLEEAERAVRQRKGSLRLGTEESICFIGHRLHFALGAHDRAIDYLNRLLSRPAADITPFGYSCARLLVLITHLEMGNYELLEYLVASTARALRARDQVFKAEEMILRFVRRTISVRTEEERRRIAAGLLEDITPLRNDPQEGWLLGWLDAFVWLECRINGTTYADHSQRLGRAKGRRVRTETAGRPYT